MTENDGDIDPQYQKGATSVEHRNIDAAGDEHPFGEDSKSFEADLRHLIRKVADELYKSWEATPREYLANAETACLKVEEFLHSPEDSIYDDMIVSEGYQPKIEVTWDKSQDDFIIKDNGIGMAAREVDEIWRQIGHSAARDDGNKSGNFGMGALSFVKLIGVDNAMIMTTHSRLNDDNAAYYVTLAGVEPIVGQLDDDEYGTKFQMTPKGDYDIREAVERYAQWMRVPVKYEEYGEDGTIVFEEDWGNKALYEEYEDNRICLGLRKRNGFEAYASPDATGQTLLLSMDIDRNDGSGGGQHGSPVPFDVRLLDESGKVIESTNGNEGLMPINRSDYENMLVEARHPAITEDHLNNKDVVGQVVEAGPNEGKMVVDGEVIQNGQPLPSKYEYIAKADVADGDEPGEARVIFGPSEGKHIVSKEEWSQMEEGRARLYVPEDELEEYDLQTGEGDLCLPEPTSDRDRLKDHPVFWKYLGQKFAEQFDQKVDEVYEMIEGSDDPIETIKSLDPDDLVISPAGFKEQ
jgi:hypothetical protein